MTLEHSETIRRRYKRGMKWREVYHANCGEMLRQEHGLSPNSMYRIRRGENTQRGAEFCDEARRRLAVADDAYQRWQQDSVSTLKAEYRMSTDTLNKIIDSGTEIMDITKQFLRGTR